jgi:ParB-like chromosome segregation protein Spo0J
MFRSPIYDIIAVKISKIEANNYNPNKVAPSEMKLLYESIKNDGYTMPIVCYYDKERDKYIIVDGFHRYSIMRQYKDIYKREKGKLPVSVIDKNLSDRMASTIRHNRARGNSDVDLISNIIAELVEIGKTESWMSKHLGMSVDEILRLKQLTGLASLFKDCKFSRAWEPDEVKDML